MWRKVQEYGNIWGVVATTTNNYWVDPEFLYVPVGGDFHPTYKVRAKDSQDLFSSFSDSTTVRAESGKRSVKETAPSQYSLGQNYPNPFNPTTTIKFDLPEPAKVSLIVYDIVGRKVAELVNEEKAAGYHSITWNAAGVASGVYLARFIASDAYGYSKYSKINKLILMK